jgi:transposase
MTQNNTNTDTTAKIINYAVLPPALRLVAAHSAVNQLNAGIKLSVVAKAFGTSSAQIKSWKKRYDADTLGAHLSSEKDADPIDWRVLTTDLRLAGRTKVVAEVKAGKDADKVAKRFGTTKLSVQRWVEMDTKGDTTYHKRGRKRLDAVVEVSTEVASEATVEAVAQ